MSTSGVGSRNDAEELLGLSSGHISTGGVIEYAEDGRFVKVRIISGLSGKKRKRSARGKIRGFTHASRTRMQQKVAAIPRGVPLPIMFTLTYHLEWPETGAGWHEHLDDFMQAFERQFGKHACMWRMEYQQRGAPHFHLLVFMEEDVDIATVKGLWHWIAGYGSPAHLSQGVSRVERVYSWRGVSSYCAKYFAKFTQSGDEDRENGRHWGVRRWAELGVRMVRKLVPQSVALRVRWLLEAVQLSTGYKPRFRRLYEGLWTYLDSANVERLIEYAQREARGDILGYG